MTAQLSSTGAALDVCGRFSLPALLLPSLALALLLPACGGVVDSGARLPVGSPSANDLGVVVGPGSDASVAPERDAGGGTIVVSSDLAAPYTGDMVVSAGAGGLAEVTVTVDASSPGMTLSPMFAGFSYEKEQMPEGLFTGKNTNLIGLFKRLGPGLMRIGANDVDRVTWSSTGKGGVFGTIAPADVDNMAAFLRAADWKIIYGVSMANVSAATAAAEAAYAATALGDRLYGLEIGNEPDLYPNKYRASTYSYSDFKGEWESFAAAIRAQAPSVVLTGPATATVYTNFTEPFAADEKSKIALLTDHYYVGDGGDAASTVAKLLAPNPGLVTQLQKLQAAASSNAISLGYRLSETNSYYNGGASGVSNAYGTSLWAIDFLFTLAAGGCAGANLHGGGDGAGYTPIADDSSGNVEGPRPEYYGMALFAQAAAGQLVKATIDGAAKSLTAYAVAENDGTTAVVILNKDGAQTVVADIDFGGDAPSATVIDLRGPALTATTGAITLGGQPIGKDGSWNPTLPTVPVSGGKAKVGVPPGSAVLVRTR